MLQVHSAGRKARRPPLFSVRKARRGEEGSAIIELSLVVYFFVIPLLFGTTVVGMLVYDSIEVSQAAHEGASYAAQVYRGSTTGFSTTTLANVTTFAKAAEPNVPASALTTPLTANPVTVTCGCAAVGSPSPVTGTCTTGAKMACNGVTPNLFVTVQTEANVTPLVSLSFLGFPKTIQLNGSSTFELAP